MRLFGVALLCAKLALIPVVFDPSLDVPFTVPKALLSHGLSYALAGVILGLLISHGASFVIRSWLHIPVLAFLAASAAAAAVAADPVLGLYGAHARMLGLGTITDYVVTYLAVVTLVRTRMEAAVAIACCLGASILVLTYEVAQLAGRDPWSWTTDVTIRPFSTVGQATSLAEYLTIIAVGAFATGLLFDRLPRPVRGLLLLYSGVLIAGAGATGTRSALVGLIAGSAPFVVLVWVLHPSRRARIMSAVVAGLAVAALAALLLFSPLGSRLASTLEVPTGDASDDPLARFEPTADTRSALYTIALGMVRERPLLGYGPDNFAVGVPKYRFENAPYEVRQSLATSPHGWVTQVATSSGIIGLFAFVGTAIASIFLTLRHGYRPLALVAIAMIGAYLGTGVTTVNDIVNDSLFWVSVAMIASVTGRSVTPSTDHPTATNTRERGSGRDGVLRPRRMAAFVCVAVGVLLALTTSSALEASRSIRSSQQSRLQGKPSDAVSLALRATRADAGRPEYWDGLGLAYVAATRFRDAGTAFERANDLAPYDVRYVGDLARALLLLDAAGESGARTRAIALAEQAVRIDPNNPQASLTRAVVMQATGNLPEAMRSVERALALDPQSGNFSLYATAIQIYLSAAENKLATGDSAAAVRAVERALTVHPRWTEAGLYVTATKVYLASGRPTDAVLTARQGMVVISPPIASVELRIELARALVATGQPAAALIELDAALALQPNNLAAQQLRAEIRAALQQ